MRTKDMKSSNKIDMYFSDFIEILSSHKGLHIVCIRTQKWKAYAFGYCHEYLQMTA